MRAGAFADTDGADPDPFRMRGAKMAGRALPSSRTGGKPEEHATPDLDLSEGIDPVARGDRPAVFRTLMGRDQLGRSRKKGGRHQNEEMSMNGKSPDAGSADMPKTRRDANGRARSPIEGKAEGGSDDLLTTQELAVWFGTATGIWDSARCYGKGPPFIRISPGVIRYRRSSVLGLLA
jgi:hypothetical protein